ncbi:MAG: hypothetical protein L6461_20870 [Anaerolineae bacterium]|nr:hypothetical protein [Anaerolineae bacterium]
MDSFYKEIIVCITNNKEWIFSGIGTTLIFTIGPLLYRHFSRKTLSFDQILDSFKNTNDDLEGYVQSDFLELVNVNKVLKKHFPGYKDFIVIQYGSSVKNDILQPNDYDFIVLLLGHSTGQTLHTFQVGTKPEKFIPDLKEIDVVFRDYSSFLFALVAGMPYENSIVSNGKIVYGAKGYFLWLKRIARNILIDRDFLLRRFENDKIPTEKQVWNNVKNAFDTYEIVRAAYFFVSSLLQRNRIRQMNEVTFHNDVAGLAFVENLKHDLSTPEHRETFDFIVQALKRRSIPKNDRQFVNKIENLIEQLI